MYDIIHYKNIFIKKHLQLIRKKMPIRAKKAVFGCCLKSVHLTHCCSMMKIRCQIICKNKINYIDLHYV